MIMQYIPFFKGFEKPKVSVDGSPLPSSRLIRTTLFPNREYRDEELNALFYSFGQYNNHDASRMKPIKADSKITNLK